MQHTPAKSAHSTTALVAGGHVAETRNPFALPLGWRGRLAGWYMSLPDAQHRELLDVVPTDRGERLLEIGFGPGQLLKMIRGREPHMVLGGVDPSELMVSRARRRNPGADLRLGAAAAIPFPDDHADVVVAVNNVPMWPDLDAALSEIDRILRPGGTAVVAWHGGDDPRGHQRKLVLSAERKATIDSAIRRCFAEVTTIPLHHSDVWIATKQATELPAAPAET